MPEKTYLKKKKQSFAAKSFVDKKFKKYIRKVVL